MDKEAAILIPQKQLNTKILSDYLLSFSQNRQLLIDMSAKSKKTAIIDATERVATICEQTVNLKNKSND